VHDLGREGAAGRWRKRSGAPWRPKGNQDPLRSSSAAPQSFASASLLAVAVSEMCEGRRARYLCPRSSKAITVEGASNGRRTLGHHARDPRFGRKDGSLSENAQREVKTEHGGLDSRRERARVMSRCQPRGQRQSGAGDNERRGSSRGDLRGRAASFIGCERKRGTPGLVGTDGAGTRRAASAGATCRGPARSSPSEKGRPGKASQMPTAQNTYPASRYEREEWKAWHLEQDCQGRHQRRPPKVGEAARRLSVASTNREKDDSSIVELVLLAWRRPDDPADRRYLIIGWQSTYAGRFRARRGCSMLLALRDPRIWLSVHAMGPWRAASLRGLDPAAADVTQRRFLGPRARARWCSNDAMDYSHSSRSKWGSGR